MMPYNTMHEDGGSPEQGLSGPLVEHDDGETYTADWGREFGPKAGHRHVLDICKDYPDNQWCRNQRAKYFVFPTEKPPEPNTSMSMFGLALAAAVLAATAYFVGKFVAARFV
mmetsp:Transcript_111146/g.358532  ORF Transcript_111146/g.358532 Transcript_111146/m.358532 type:complete len:112 (-) Transcript_111146:151-486(-)